MLKKLSYSFLFPALATVRAVVPAGVHRVIAIGTDGSVIDCLLLSNQGVTNMAKPYRMVALRQQVWQWRVPVGTVALKCGNFFHCEHASFPRKVFVDTSPLKFLLDRELLLA